MMIITTRAKKLTKNTASVAWKTGTINKGIITVTVNDPRIYENISAVAELCVIYHLLYERNIFNVSTIYSGAGYKLDMTHGVIKKLLRKKLNNKALWHYAAFLQYRLPSVKIVVGRSMEGMPNKDDTETVASNLVVDSFPFERNYNVVTSPAIGRVAITRHAVEQFAKRTSMGKPKDPLKSLMRQVTSPNLILNRLPKNVLEHKALKYGKNDKVELWSGSSSTLKFLVIENLNGQKTLVTAFERNI